LPNELAGSCSSRVALVDGFAVRGAIGASPTAASAASVGVPGVCVQFV